MQAHRTYTTYQLLALFFCAFFFYGNVLNEWACVGVHERLGLQVYNATRDVGFGVTDGASTVVAADGLHKRDVFSK